MKSHSGFGLIELMIAVTIGLLLLSMILQIYLTNLNSYRLQLALNQVQQNAKTAIDILNTEIHQAGYIGCAHLTYDFPIFSYPPYTLMSHNKISSQKVDEITIRRADFPAAVLIEPMQDTSILSVSHHVRFSSGDILIISNCNQAEIFEVKEIKSFQGGQKIISHYPLHHQYEQQTEVSRFVINTYFIANTHRRYANGKPIYSLFVKDINQRKSELIEGIQQMRIRYLINHDEASSVAGVSIDFNVVSQSLNKVWHLYAAME